MWIPKLMMQFCYLRLFEGTETVSWHLSLRMAWMEWIETWKNWPIFFPVLMLRAPKILKKFIMASPHCKIIWHLRRSFTEAFCLWLKPQSNMILVQNCLKTAKSSWHCTFIIAPLRPNVIRMVQPYNCNHFLPLFTSIRCSCHRNLGSYCHDCLCTSLQVFP